MLLKCSRSLTGRKPLTVCVHTGTRRTTPLTGMTALSMIQELYTAISRLPDKQAKRIYAHFILGLTKQDIARAEGVDEKVVRLAIERGLRNLEKILKKFL